MLVSLCLGVCICMNNCIVCVCAHCICTILRHGIGALRFCGCLVGVGMYEYGFEVWFSS